MPDQDVLYAAPIGTFCEFILSNLQLNFSVHL